MVDCEQILLSYGSFRFGQGRIGTEYHMLEDRSASLAENFELEFDCEELDPREIVHRCKYLPDKVRRAELTHIEKRVVDKALIAELTNPESLENQNEESIDRLRNRRKALISYLGSTLVCVFVRLPGCHYTIEIDPVDRSVIHWEWQHT